MKFKKIDLYILNILGIIRFSCFVLIAITFQKDILKKKEIHVSKVNPTIVHNLVKITTIEKKIVPKLNKTVVKSLYPAKKCEKLSTIRSQLLTRMNIKLLPKIKIKKQIKIAVIDTGLNINVSAFHHRLYLPKDLVLDPNGFGIDYSTEKVSYKPIDTNGHGSNVSGILISLFPQAKILPIKYYNPKKSGNENLDALNKSLRAAIDANVDIINISGGGPQPSREEFELLSEAKDKGIIVVLAAGNERSNVNEKEEPYILFNYIPKHGKNSYYPASYNLDNMISVMNIRDDLSKDPSSNYGKNSIHLAALGNAIYSYGSVTDNNCAIKMTGTSQSTPIVTATVAMIKAEFPHLSYQEIKAKVLESTRKYDLLENLNATNGIIDIERSLANVKKENQVK